MGAELVEYLKELFAGFARVDVRAMFGGHGIYRDGTIFAIAIEDQVYLKVDDATRARFEAEGSAPFVYEGGKTPITMSYWSAPADALDSPDAMRPWAELAYAAALGKAVAKRARGKTAAKKPTKREKGVRGN